MNLRAIANTLTQTINPNVPAVLQVCIGYAKDASFKRVPVYAEGVPIIIQAQSLTKREIEHLDGLNFSDAMQGVYANAQLTGIDRKDQSGGDLLTYADPASGRVNVWLVVAVLEGWNTSGWSKAAIAKQMDLA